MGLYEKSGASWSVTMHSLRDTKPTRATWSLLRAHAATCFVGYRATWHFMRAVWSCSPCEIRLRVRSHFSSIQVFCRECKCLLKSRFHMVSAFQSLTSENLRILLSILLYSPELILGVLRMVRATWAQTTGSANWKPQAEGTISAVWRRKPTLW